MDWKGVKITSRDGRAVGIATGATRSCQLSGCLGLRICVKWPDGKTTYPCTKGMRQEVNGEWRIE